MLLKINGLAIAKMKYNDSPITAAKINGSALWPTTVVPLGNLYGRLIVRDDVLTATHFKTTALNETIKYRMHPGGSLNTGTLVAEYMKSSIGRIVPLVRGLDSIDKEHLRLRQFSGLNTNGIDISFSNFSSWTNFANASASAGANDRIYIMDVTEQKWISFNPRERNLGSIGGSFINWNITSSIPSGARSSFSDLVAIQTWLQTVRSAVSHEFVIAILSNTSLTPVF